MTGSISFDSNSLQTFSPLTRSGIVTNVIDHADLPEKEMSLYAIANADASVIPNVEYPNRIIKIAGVLAATSQSNLDALIDTFKGYFRGKDKNLDINYAGSTRRYIATVNSIGIKRNGSLSFAEFSIEFVCTIPFGSDTSATSIINQVGYTSSSYTVAPTIGGNAPEQLPVFTITINSFTGAGDYLQISNNDNGQEILLYGQGIEAGDVIVIDSINKEVTIDSDPVDYNGTFIELAPGAASITYSDGFDTRNVDIQASYFKRYF